MKRKLKLICAAFGVLLPGIQLIPSSERTNPSTDPARAMSARIPTPPEVDAILKRACYDCHSNATVWPWYSRVNPTAWFVIGHVDHGRRHVNFSDWNVKEAKENIEHICSETRQGNMPIGSYLWLHPSAKLSAKDVDALCAWSRRNAVPQPMR